MLTNQGILTVLMLLVDGDRVFMNDDRCDICGAKLDPEDVSIHLCKICQAMQEEENMV